MKRLFPIILNILPYISVFLFSLYQPIDSDLGWHLKYGEYFFTHGKILRDNIFSSEMNSYHWINHSWLSDSVTYFAYRDLGFLGVSLLGALTVVGTLFFISKSASLTWWQKSFLFPLTLYFMELLNKVSFRAQLVTLMFTCCAYLIFSKFKKGSVKYLFFLPLLFLIWVNFHGGFIQGLGLFFLWSIFYLVINLLPRHAELVSASSYFSNIKHKIFYYLLPLLALLVSVFVTLINPFGISIYGEALHHFGNPLSQYIVEWTSFDAYTIYWWRLLSWGLYIGVSIFILFKNKKLREYLPEILPLVLIFFLSFSARRYTWTLLLLSIPIIKYLDNIISVISQKTIKIIYFLVFSGIIIYSLYLKLVTPYGIRNLSWENYCRYTSCSFASAEFLKKVPYKNLYTFYDWGGWLIWNYPKIKPSVDGRMSFWRDNKDYSAFENNFYLEQNILDINKSPYDTVYISTHKPIYKRMLALVNENRWELLYEDRVSAIFKRKSSSLIGPHIPTI
ncbi:hypothetical protein A3D77_06990 [Candidatus Gottesmanbacteria bacterium RIFCSPHIGHO2_02_FULL_39_11]|uniref:Glycosyltransferase RgtA/B/C/D-like domain-containing protein n=1 Tax=Candidatus Gottesmanbacteria bacterium RIFCSPHIGHO2_02_FULL_39_11 TaxID=1798382 RepID=A0A1F5ZKC7_9BACT|nr:MAG: hypothetical protein A3D77_06990 [Candidatus Gottesmanbacteria bacterium RIFCSPHIGHO2_02_FULL_39_11]